MERAGLENSMLQLGTLKFMIVQWMVVLCLLGHGLHRKNSLCLAFWMAFTKLQQNHCLIAQPSMLPTKGLDRESSKEMIQTWTGQKFVIYHRAILLTT